MKAPEPRLLGVKDAAAYLGCTVWAVRTLVWEMQIPHIKLGRRLLIDVKDLDDLIDERKSWNDDFQDQYKVKRKKRTR